MARLAEDKDKIFVYEDCHACSHIGKVKYPESTNASPADFRRWERQDDCSYCGGTKKVKTRFWIHKER